MLSDSDLQYFEAVCRELCVPTDPQKRLAAEKALIDFVESPTGLQNCLSVLQKCNGYPCLFVVNWLAKVAAVKDGLPPERRRDLRTFLLNYIGSRTDLDPFLRRSVYRLVCRLIKSSWFDLNDQNEADSQATVSELIKMCEYDANRVVAVDLLADLVTEMNQIYENSMVAKQLKISSVFRDYFLCDIFTMCTKFLKSIADSSATFSSREVDGWDTRQKPLLQGLLLLSYNCLSYDFVDSRGSESSDEMASVMIPASWRELFISNDFVRIYHTIFMRYPEFSRLALDNLVQMASIRRTLLDHSKRREMLSAMMNSIIEILNCNRVPNDPDSFHKLTLLICRLKGNHQVSEFSQCDVFPTFLEKVVNLTVQSLMTVNVQANSLHYLLAFWQLMVTGLAYLREGKHQAVLEKAASVITQAFIESRMKVAELIENSEMDDPLEDTATKWDQVNQFAVICRHDYERTCDVLIQNFNQNASTYSVVLSQGESRDLPVLVIENKLSWLVYLMGSAVSGRATYTQVEKHDEKDGEMISKVFQLMKLTGGRPPKAPIKLEFAYLWFLYQFRKTYLTDNCPKISSVFQTLYQSLGLQDEVAIVSLLVDKVLDNLQRVPSNADLIVKSIELLDEMSAGHVAAKLLIEIPQIQFVLKSQTLDQFAALSRDGDLATLKLRGRLYQTLTGLICFIMDDSLADRFNGFFMPFKVTITRLGELIAVNDSSLHDQEKTKKAIIALARDLCGVFRACTGRQSYAKAFDLAYPRCFQIFFRACELWSIDPTVMVPILRLYREICISRTQRMLFSVNVPTGFILFKEVSKMITAYATRLLAVTDVPESHMYTVCYKGLSLVFSILHHVLCGDYVNFGVFLLYQDNCFNDAFNVFIEITLKVGKEQIMVYPKFMRSFHELFSKMTEDHMTYVGNLDPKVQIYLLQMILDGINNLSTDIVTLACASLDNMLMYMYECYSRLENDWVSGLEMVRRNDNCLALLRMNPPVLRELFSTLANSVLLGECRCTWSMSRPLFCMIMLLEQQYNELKMEIVRSQPSACQGFVTDLLNSLTNNLPRNLHTKTKDSFTANVSSFRQHFSKSSKRLATLSEVQEMLNA